jgi:RNA polymerase sigma-70 factor (ECF subfamily)
LRTWLYRIATNACLTALAHHGRRVLPSGLGAPSDDPAAPVVVAGSDIAWLQPMPDALVNPESDDPAVIAAARDSIRLALIASLQYLPARQRAVLLLRDVLAFPAAEVATMLDTTTTAVKSALQRARARIEEVAPAADRVTEPTEPELLALLDQYIKAFENSDAKALEQALRMDAALEMTGTKTWFSGRATCMPFLITQGLGFPGEWRMVPVVANAQPAAMAYRLAEDGVHRAYGVAVLTGGNGGIAKITVFGDPVLAVKFAQPTEFAEDGAR